jgi:hypothetical protein
MKKVTVYESEDGSLHKTPDSAIRRDLIRLINDNSRNIEVSGRYKASGCGVIFSMSVLLHKVYLATDMETLKNVIAILNKAANLDCHVSDVGEVTPR